jgi:hypothetical protein
MFDDDDDWFDLFDHDLDALSMFDGIFDDLLSWFCWWRR